MTQSATKSTDVLIVGAGPSGLMAALLLAHWNVRTIVVERNASTEEHPKAHELNARSIEILRDVQIFEEDLAGEASPLDHASRVLFCRTINEELGRIELLADPTRKKKYDDHLRQTLPYLNLSQSEFEKILRARAETSPFIDLRFGHRWEGCHETTESISSSITSETSYTIESKYLLGCDGASSRVRKAVGIEMSGPARIQSFVNAYFKVDLTDVVAVPAKLYWILHPEFAGTFIAHHMGRRWVYAVPVQEPWERPDDFTADVMRARIQGALGFDVPELKITSLSTWHMTAQVAVSYRRGRVFLIGDAAHRFPPTGGLGMNTGIADAHNLCWKLALTLLGKAGDSLLDSYESERKPVAESNCAESHRNFEKIFDVITALGIDPAGMPLLARVMNSRPVRILPQSLQRRLLRAVTTPAYWLVSRALRPGRIRQRVQLAIANQTSHFDRLGLDIGYVYSEGAIVSNPIRKNVPGSSVSDYVPSTAPGARLPHRWVGPREDKVSTHDFIRYTEFTLWATRNHLDRLQCAGMNQVRTVDTSEFPSDLIRHDDLLLVRPDGHIAWRTLAETVDKSRLQDVLVKLLASSKNSAAVGAPVGED